MPVGCWIIGRFNASCLVFHTEIIFPLQKVICTAEALHRLVFTLISHISSILAPMPCSMQFSRITDFFNNQQSQLGPGRNPSMCAATQVVTGLPARTLQPNQLLPTLVTKAVQQKHTNDWCAFAVLTALRSVNLRERVFPRRSYGHLHISLIFGNPYFHSARKKGWRK